VHGRTQAAAVAGRDDDDQGRDPGECGVDMGCVKQRAAAERVGVAWEVEAEAAGK
jgi:hypothetical protein